MEKDPAFAQGILKGILALDGPLGQLMEIVKTMEDASEKAAIKDCCSALLRLQFDLVEQVEAAYPQLSEHSGSDDA